MGPGLPPNRITLKRRLLLVALDAMDVQWLRALAVRGDLPNLARFIVSAQGAEVRSDGGTLHGPVWPTFAPGAGPGHHGRYWWMQWLPQDMRYVRSSDPAFAYDPFWLGIAEAGRRVVVLDVPYAPLVRRPRWRGLRGRFRTREEVEGAALVLGAWAARLRGKPADGDVLADRDTVRRHAAMLEELGGWLRGTAR